MSKKAYAIISSGFILAITIVLLLVFLLIPNKNEFYLFLNKNLSSNINDISLTVGDKIYDYYEVSDKSAELSFDLDKEGIINIDEFMIEGVKAGEVHVIMTAKTQKQTTQTEFNVKVYNNNYTIKFIAINSCSFDNENIYIDNSTFQFNIEVYDNLNLTVENVKFNIISSNKETIIDKNLLSVIVVAREQCSLTFIFEDLSICFSKNVIIK